METTKPRILLDCDGVMADLCGGFLDAIEEETGERFGHAVITEWNITDSPFFKKLAQEHRHLKEHVWARVNRIGWCAALKPIDRAQECVEILRGIADIEVVTSPLDSSPTWMPERKEWLKRHFGIHPNDVHFVSKKERVIGDMLLDDKPSHCLSWRREMLAKNIPHYNPDYPHPAVIFHQPYNEMPSDEVMRETWRAWGWDVVVAMVERMLIQPGDAKETTTLETPW